MFAWTLFSCYISQKKEAIPIVPLIQAEIHALPEHMGEGYLILHTSRHGSRYHGDLFCISPPESKVTRKRAGSGLDPLATRTGRRWHQQGALWAAPKLCRVAARINQTKPAKNAAQGLERWGGRWESALGPFPALPHTWGMTWASCWS